jgi:hypothetical protein
MKPNFDLMINQFCAESFFFPPESHESCRRPITKTEIRPTNGFRLNDKHSKAGSDREMIRGHFFPFPKLE